MRLLAAHRRDANMAGSFDLLDLLTRVALTSSPAKLSLARQIVETAAQMALEQPAWKWHEVASVLILATQVSLYSRIHTPSLI